MTDAARRGRLFRTLSRVACGGIVLTAIALLSGLIRAGESIPEGSDALLMAIAVAAAATLGRVRYRFSEAEPAFELHPAAGIPLAVGLWFGPLWGVLIVVVIAAASWTAGDVTRRVTKMSGVIIGVAAGTGGAMIVMGDRVTDAEWILASALMAATIRTMSIVVTQYLAATALDSDAAGTVARRTHERDFPISGAIGLDVGLPAAAVGLSTPFLARPVVAGVVLVACTLAIWMIHATLHRTWIAERRSSRTTGSMARYVPAAVARQLERESGGEDGPAPGGEQRDVTVLFVDVRGFTGWLEHQEPSEVIAELNALLGELGEAVMSTGGTLDKFTGDGLMAFWGAPDEQPDHAARALQCVPQLLMRAREFNLRRDARGMEALDIGIGINTGSAVVGNIGHRDRMDYTAIGDTTNLAARLESATRSFSCPLLLSEATFLALPIEMKRQCARMESIRVKGRSDRVQCFTLTWLARYRTDWWRETG